MKKAMLFILSVLLLGVLGACSSLTSSSGIGKEVLTIDEEREQGMKFEVNADGNKIYMGLTDRGVTANDEYFVVIEDGKEKELEGDFLSHFGYFNHAGDAIINRRLGVLYVHDLSSDSIEEYELGDGAMSYGKNFLSSDNTHLLVVNDDDEYEILNLKTKERTHVGVPTINGEEYFHSTREYYTASLNEDGSVIYFSLNAEGLYKYDVATEQLEQLYVPNNVDRFYAQLTDNPNYIHIQQDGNSVIYDLSDGSDYPVDYTILGVLETGKAWYRDHDEHKVYVVDIKSGDTKEILDHSDGEGGRDFRLEAIDLSYDGSTLYYIKREEDDYLLMEKDVSSLTK
ncbi:hypothetical protein [Evansella cellulosilytica]|uniref:Lipoprotein n=1 Tax=Evansella cellulosilytica (strain ATCC 21833 / DSM 2522 / FERM P-1141 / JCM 9156 / N-4) TaxID=649639 RepID=E6TRG1_EVAC2|nr:hypothetical protein [Evansella cellulosilytica]ADU31791.1 hypothetical protein Bcell_3550 [Evansella cellulosilytica DSM 2522]